MKQLTRSAFILKYALFQILFTLTTAIAWAQDSSSTAVTTETTSTSSTTQETWYTAPWVWVVGIAVLILIIVALTRGNKSGGAGRTDKVTYTKKTETE